MELKYEKKINLIYNFHERFVIRGKVLIFNKFLG